MSAAMKWIIKYTNYAFIHALRKEQGFPDLDRVWYFSKMYAEMNDPSQFPKKYSNGIKEGPCPLEVIGNTVYWAIYKDFVEESKHYVPTFGLSSRLWLKFWRWTLTV